VCLTPSAVVARQASGLYSSVHAYVVDNLNDTASLITETAKEAVRVGAAKTGDLMVVVSGMLYGNTHNNQVRVEIVPDFSKEEAAVQPKMRRLKSFEYQSE
jgi:pyruvate kinase